MRRLDIQGLRAVGALLVAIFHIFQWGVSGGVDVFLVVSGFFLWPKLSNIARTGRGFTSYYARFFERTAPQAILVVLVTLTGTFFLISPVEWSDVIRDAAFSLAFMQNYWLAVSGQNYLARDVGLSLFQHYWAISVIAQTYFLFPIMAGVAISLSLLFGGDRQRYLIAVMALISISSFAWGLLFSAANPAFAYFDTASRIWQFGLGAMAAAFLTRRSTVANETNSSGILSWVGLILVMTCGALWGRSFPGIVTIWPTIGALLILLYSHDTTRIRSSGSILSSRWLSSLGAISFGFYLWHWPLYAILFRFFPEQGIISAASIIGISVILAFFGTSLVGNVDRALSRVGGVFLYGMPAISMAMITALGGVLLVIDKEINSQDSVFSGMYHPLWEFPLAITALRKDVPVSYKTGCNQSQTVASVKACSYGEIHSSTTMVLVGGSHSAQFLPSLRAIAESNDIHLISLTKSYCRFFDPDSLGMEDYLSESCRDWNRNVKAYLNDQPPDIVVTLVNSRGDADVSGIRHAIAGIVDSGILAIAIRDTPEMGFDVPACVAKVPIFGAPDCRRLKASLLDDDSYALTRSKLPNEVIHIDINDEICPNEYCDVVREKILMWRDSHHLTATYARSLAGKLWSKLEEPLRQRNLGGDVR